MDKIINDIISVMRKKSDVLEDILILVEKINPGIDGEILNNLNNELNNKFNELKMIDEEFKKLENTYKKYIEDRGYKKIIKEKFLEHEKLSALIQNKFRIKINKLNKEKEKIYKDISKINVELKKVTKFKPDDSNPYIFEEKI